MTTHYLDEAEHLADRVGVLSKGQLVAEGTPEELTARQSGTVLRFALPDAISVEEASATLVPLLGAPIRLSGGLVETSVEQPTSVVHALTGWAMDHGHELDSLTVERASLEDVYLALVEADGDAAAEGSES